MINALLRVGKFAWQDFYRNIWLSIATITILVLTLLSVNFVVAVNAVASQASQSVEDRVDISLHFQSTIDEEKILGVKRDLADWPEIATVDYISRDEAIADFRARHASDLAILEALDHLADNPLGAVLRIKARQITDYPTILTKLDTAEYNQLVASRDYEDRQTIIEMLTAITTKVRQIGIGIVIVFTLIAGLIVFNTVRVTIYTHREEIAMMKLVGATNWFVRLPFVIEGIIYGIVAALLTIILLYPILRVFQPYVAGVLAADWSIVDYFMGHALGIFGTEVLAISILNVLSGLVATRRYLRV